MAKGVFSLIAVLLSTLVLQAQGIERTLYINHQKVSCTGVAPMRCMQYRYTPNESWKNMYDGIVGFNYEEGYNYTVIVKEEKIEHPPADATAVRRTLIRIISKTKANTTMHVEGNWQIVEARSGVGSSLDLAGKNYTVTLDSGTIKGKVCNVFNGSFEISKDGAVKPGLLRTTRMMCPDMATETAILTALGKVNKASLEESMLTLMQDTVVLLRMRKPGQAPESDLLSGKVFKVMSMKNTSGNMVNGPENSFMKFDLSQSQVGGKGGCNSFFGQVGVKFTGTNIGEIKFSRMGSTMMACPNLSEEQQLFKNLEAADNFEISNNELYIKKGIEVLITCKTD